MICIKSRKMAPTHYPPTGLAAGAGAGRELRPTSNPSVRQVLAGFIATPIVGEARPCALAVEMQLVITDDGPCLRTRASWRLDQVHWAYTTPKRPYAEFFNERGLFAADAAWRVQDKPSANDAVYKRARQEASQRWWHHL